MYFLSLCKNHTCCTVILLFFFKDSGETSQRMKLSIYPKQAQKIKTPQESVILSHFFSLKVHVFGISEKGMPKLLNVMWKKSGDFLAVLLTLFLQPRDTEGLQPL